MEKEEVKIGKEVLEGEGSAREELEREGSTRDEFER